MPGPESACLRNSSFPGTQKTDNQGTPQKVISFGHRASNKGLSFDCSKTAWLACGMCGRTKISVCRAGRKRCGKQKLWTAHERTCRVIKWNTSAG